MLHYDVPEVNPATLDLSTIVADIHEIRRHNPHRFEMELLTAITEINTEKHFIVGYKDTTETDFWVRGHMPGFALMPGVVMIEAAAQLCSFYLRYGKINPTGTIGLGGVEMAKFKRMVRPGDRLVLVGHGVKIDRRLSKVHAVGYVNGEEAFRTVILGAPLRGVDL